MQKSQEGSWQGLSVAIATCGAGHLLVEERIDDHFYEYICKETDGRREHDDDIRVVHLVAFFFAVIIENILAAFDA